MFVLLSVTVCMFMSLYVNVFVVIVQDKAWEDAFHEEEKGKEALSTPNTFSVTGAGVFLVVLIIVAIGMQRFLFG